MEENIIVETNNELMKELGKIEFYQKHPFLIPFIGKNYGINCPKILVVLESHYLPIESEFYSDYLKIDSNDKEAKMKWLEKNWYEKDLSSEGLEEQSLFTRAEIGHIHTKEVIEYNIARNNKFQNLFLKFLKPIYEHATKENDIKDKTHYLETINNIAYMNYFLRSSERNKTSIEIEEIDKKYSYEIFKTVWEKLGKPIIILCSAKAGYAFKKYNNKDKENNKPHIDENFIWLNHPDNRSWKRNKFDSEKVLVKRLCELNTKK